MRYLKVSLLLLLIATAICCRKSYTPSAVTSQNAYLVVEGAINLGTDSTIIKLSRTVNVSASTTVNPVSKATITIESDNSNSYPLAETSTDGKYAVSGLALDNTRKYRLRIKTSDNQEYLSDYVESKVTPPIDSVGFNITNNGMQVYANAHDDKNATRYYMWTYDETWRFHSKYQSDYVSNGTKIIIRPINQYIYYCFASAASTSITLGSSAKLAKDVIFESPITLIGPTSEKIELRYSILLKQYALTADGYNFWLNLKKNTEQLGSIFDAQPSNINGNIHNVANASEVVIGYISACTVQSKRVFIDKSQLPSAWKPTYPYSCTLDSIFYSHPGTGYNEVVGTLIPLPATKIPVSAFFGPNSFDPLGYLSSSVECVDCTIRGSVAQPSFWK